MLTRYWQWTNGEAPTAGGGLPYGPLRYRAWTSIGAPAAGGGLPYGPLRFRAWTSAAVVPPIIPGGGGRWPEEIRIRVPAEWREDEEWLWVLVMLAASDSLN